MLRIFLFVVFIGFLSSSSLVALSMSLHFNIDHPSCIALVVNGIACPKGSLWDYLLFHLSAIKKVSNFIPSKFYSSYLFLFLFIFLLLFFKAQNSDYLISLFLPVRLSILSLGEINYLKKFYHWLSLHEKSGEALNN